MPLIADLCRFLNDFAPLDLAEEWDNVGLLLGDASRPAARVMTCLTVTSASAEEAIARGANLIVAHHPLPFRPLKRITTDSTAGGLVWKLAAAGVAVYSPHTAFDSAAAGINQCLAEGLGLEAIEPLRPSEAGDRLGAGRCGTLPQAIALSEMIQRVKAFLGVEHLHAVGSLERAIGKAAVACGSAGEFLAEAEQLGCQLLVTGETSFHTCLEAEARGLCLLLTGHYPSERFAVERLAEVIGKSFGDVEVWASEREADPVRWV